MNYENYKGIYNDQQISTKYIDPESGAHFSFGDICKKLKEVKKIRDKNSIIVTPVDNSRNSNIKQSISSSKPNSILIISDYRKKHLSQINYANQKQANKSFAFSNSKIEPLKHITQKEDNITY